VTAFSANLTEHVSVVLQLLRWCAWNDLRLFRIDMAADHAQHARRVCTYTALQMSSHCHVTAGLKAEMYGRELIDPYTAFWACVCYACRDARYEGALANVLRAPTQQQARSARRLQCSWPADVARA
jgi:hypothetical protein